MSAIAGDRVMCACRRPRPGRTPAGVRRSRARSSVVRMMQQPPSEITQQSSLCSGSATSFESSTSSTVIGSRYIASGLRCRVLACLHRDRRELLGLRPVLVHVPLRGHRVRADERETGRELVGHRAGHRGAAAASTAAGAERAARRRQLVVAVDDRDRVDVAVLDRTVTRASRGTRSSSRRRSSIRASAA